MFSYEEKPLVQSTSLKPVKCSAKILNGNSALQSSHSSNENFHKKVIPDKISHTSFTNSMRSADSLSTRKSSNEFSAEACKSSNLSLTGKTICTGQSQVSDKPVKAPYNKPLTSSSKTNTPGQTLSKDALTKSKPIPVLTKPTAVSQQRRIKTMAAMFETSDQSPTPATKVSRQTSREEK